MPRSPYHDSRFWVDASSKLDPKSLLPRPLEDPKMSLPQSSTICTIGVLESRIAASVVLNPPRALGWCLFRGFGPLCIKAQRERERERERERPKESLIPLGGMFEVIAMLGRWDHNVGDH